MSILYQDFTGDSTTREDGTSASKLSWKFGIFGHLRHWV